MHFDLPGIALAQSSSGSVIVWAAVLVAVVIAATVALLLVRRWLLGAPGDEPSEGLSLQDLRDLRRKGALSEEEFEAAKRVIVGAAGAGPSRNPITGAERPRPDA